MTAATGRISRRRRLFQPHRESLASASERMAKRLRERARRTEPLLEQAKTVLAPVTPLGWVMLSGGISLLWLGLARGWVEVVVLAIALQLTWALALAWTFGRMAYVARIDLDVPRVNAGEQAFGRVAIRSRGVRSLLPSMIELPVGRSSHTFDLPALNADTEHELLFAIPTRRRGVIPIGPLRSVKADPFGLFRRERPWTEREELYVHPTTVPLAAAATGFLRDIEGVTTHNLTSSDVTFHALRDYVAGDDLRAVHWRTTARVGHLVVRQFEETRRAHLLVVLSLRHQDYASPEEFELAISCVGSLVRQARRDERQVDVATSAGRLAVPSAMALLDQLCGVALVPDSPPLRETVASTLAAIPSISMITLVAGSAASSDAWHAAHVVAPLDVLTVAIRTTGLDGSSARRRVAGMTMVDVPSLEQLPRAVRMLR